MTPTHPNNPSESYYFSNLHTSYLAKINETSSLETTFVSTT